MIIYIICSINFYKMYYKTLIIKKFHNSLLSANILFSYDNISELILFYKENETIGGNIII